MSAVIHETPFAAINRAVLDTILRAYNQGDHDTLAALGVAADLAHELSQMNSRALHKLTLHRGLLSQIQMANQISGLIHASTASSDQDEQLNELIRFGASLPMMEALSRMHTGEFQRRRQLVGISKRRFRPRKLTVSECTQCGAAWLRHSNLPPIQRYIAVAKETELDLASVWQEIQFDAT